mmetsp:Transcript_7181/g.15675  ORF Transcript_7181/g.15675 Transcript_7181/m.15675 type:complete len:309 (-) Transcript_7181:169-1095(-)|eukprot:CAMPEP_0178505984 /NCGR_PEP_ID=MMETSP0696-20121128/19427_1 /TAXON_ID=265572 /ORGANISM="Extubocellulus spinifer, Strain CCMP396" /LENGTH=308 /DNA_ID=CAMNT_0020135341 /DNA_START=123 /DNA_END=1049 /DNA_ORIENTATION=+
MAGLGRRSHYRKHLTDSVLNDFPEPNPSEGERLARVVGTRGSNQFEIILSLPSSSSVSTLNHGSDMKRIPKLAILPTKFRKLVWVKRNDFVIVRCGDDEERQRNVNGDGDIDIDRGSDKYHVSDDNNKSTGMATTKRISEGGGRKEEEVLKYCHDSSSSLPRGAANDLAASAGGPDPRPDESISGIRYEISSILYKDQVKHLRRKGVWPINDPYFQEDGVGVSDSGGRNDLVECVDGEDDSSPRQQTTRKPVGEESDEAECLVDGYGKNVDKDDDGIIYDDDLLFVNTNKISALRVLDSESDSESDSR